MLAPVIASSQGSNVDLIAFYGPITYVVALLVSFQVPKLLQALGGYGLGLLCVAVSAAGLLFLVAAVAFIVMEERALISSADGVSLD